jgi:hypothetical protein
MAHLIRPWQVRYVLDGKRVPAGTPGAARVRQRASKWYGAGIPGQQKGRRVPLATNKDVARRLLANMVREAEMRLAGMPVAQQTRPTPPCRLRTRPPEVSRPRAEADLTSAIVGAPRANAEADGQGLRDDPCVYFVQDLSGGLIKIGHTGNWRKRAQALCTGNGSPLVLLALIRRGGRKMEKALHVRFAHLRHHGEWFRPEPDLLQYVLDIIRTAPRSRPAPRRAVATTPATAPEQEN